MAGRAAMSSLIRIDYDVHAVAELIAPVVSRSTAQQIADALTAEENAKRLV